MEKRQIFFGSGNSKKLKEIGEILGDLFDIKNFNDLPAPLEVEETELTLEGNARLKALAFYEATKIPCFADDTGLEVEALNGAPGVFSARYAGEENNADANMNKLLVALEGQNNRNARFRTVIAWFDGQEISYFEGIVNGKIAFEKTGTNGFGYDPIFIPEGENRSMAQLSAEEKNNISHRGRAVRKFAQYLRAQ